MAEESSPKVEGKGSPAKMVLVIMLGAAVLVAASIGTVFYMMKHLGMIGGEGGGGGSHGASAEKGPAIYQSLDPPFVVNFKDKGRNRFLQITMQAMTRDETVIEELVRHMPLIRNNILLLLSSQDSETLYSNDGKEQLRAKALVELNAVLEKETGKPNVIESLYFTSFVTQ